MKAVITTDIVHSSNMSPTEREMFNERLEGLKKWLLNNQFIKEASDFYEFRGDSFQLLIQKPVMALSVAFLIKMEVRSWSLPQQTGKAIKGGQSVRDLDLRISVGIGSVDLQTAQLGTSDGEAFQLSGRRLDNMKKEKRTFCISTNDVYKEELEVESFLLDALLARATPLQCEVLRYKIEGITEIEIAEKLGIQQPAVNQRATKGDWHALEKMLERFKTMYHG